jgi:1,4-alpha-glucan branching enzyme
MHRGDSGGNGMRWVEAHDADHGLFAWLRVDPTDQARPILVVVNATPTPQYNYRLGVPVAGSWEELINTDAAEYGGSGLGNFGGVATAPLDSHDHHQSVVLTLPPLAAIALAPGDM